MSKIHSTLYFPSIHSSRYLFGCNKDTRLTDLDSTHHLLHRNLGSDKTQRRNLRDRDPMPWNSDDCNPAVADESDVATSQTPDAPGAGLQGAAPASPGPLALLPRPPEAASCACCGCDQGDPAPLRLSRTWHVSSESLRHESRVLNITDNVSRGWYQDLEGSSV